MVFIQIMGTGMAMVIVTIMVIAIITIIMNIMLMVKIPERLRKKLKNGLVAEYLN